MTNYYFDIETTGLNPEKSQIITIQFQKLDYKGNTVGDLTILKSWESSEEEILKELVKRTTILDMNNPWGFVPVGYNLSFESKFLNYKLNHYNICNNFDLLQRPHIDLFHMAIIFNQGQFKGSGLDKISGKEGDGFQVIEAHSFGDYNKIIEYIEMETKEFLKLYVHLLITCTKFKGNIFPYWK